MKQMSTLAKLDLVLNTIAASSHPLHAAPDIEHQALWRTVTANGTNNAYILDFELIIEKLLNDKFIKVDTREVTWINEHGMSAKWPRPHYAITFDGRYFLESTGGYVDKATSNEVAEKIKNNREKMLSTGTVLLAIGTFLLVLWEIYKTYWIEHPDLRILPFCH